jgi:hypothetical protein
MRSRESLTLKDWFHRTLYLIGAIPIYLMVSLATVSFLLVVFIVGISETVGLIQIKVKAFVSSSTHTVAGILPTWLKNLTWRK